MMAFVSGNDIDGMESALSKLMIILEDEANPNGIMPWGTLNKQWVH